MKRTQHIILVILTLFLMVWNLIDFRGLGDFVMWEFRTPRVLGALFAGWGLAMSGLMMQTLFRNPLAGPFLIGVTPGAGLGMAFYIFLGGFLPVSISQFGSSMSAMIGAIAILGLQLLLNRGFGSPIRMLLTGMVLGFLASALIQLMQQLSNVQELQQFTFWGMGSFEKIQWPDPLSILLPVLIIGILFWSRRGNMDSYLLGDMVLQSDGISLIQTRRILVLGGAILAGYITSFCGPIGFVGLVGPHIAKRISQTESHQRVMIPAILWGGFLSLAADTIAHDVVPGMVFQVNPITALIGSPILIWSLRQRKNSIRITPNPQFV